MFGVYPCGSKVGKYSIPEDEKALCKLLIDLNDRCPLRGQLRLIFAIVYCILPNVFQSPYYNISAITSLPVAEMPAHWQAPEDLEKVSQV